jgi:hypothetical protein
MRDLDLIFMQTRESGWKGDQNEDIQLFPGLLQPNLRAGVLNLIPSITVTIGLEETEAGGTVEVWAEEEDRIYASFTDEEAEDEEEDI